MNDLGTQRGTCEDNEGYTEIQSILFNCALLHKFIISLTASDTICNLEIQKWNEITFCSTIWKGRLKRGIKELHKSKLKLNHNEPSLLCSIVPFGSDNNIIEKPLDKFSVLL